MAQLNACLTGDQVVGLQAPGLHHSFVEIDHENLFYDHSYPSADSGREVVSYLRKNVH